MSQHIFPDEVCSAGTHAVSSVIQTVIQALADDPDLALSSRYDKVRDKEALAIDWDAEVHFREIFRHEYKQGMFRDTKIYGEESIKESTDFSGESGLIALTDMVDGTDLLERNLSNWCSAVVFFNRTEESTQIIGACVGLPSGRIYSAHTNSNNARYVQFYRDSNKRPTGGLVMGPSTITSLEHSSICFYGQKAKSLQRVAKTKLFDYLISKEEAKDALKRERDQRSGQRFISVEREKVNRIYTLSGIPMMMRLIDHRVKDAANIDVIFQLTEQHPHDAVPGLYIAKKGGAYILNLKTGREMTDEELTRGLLRPGHPDEGMKYIVAATRDLCDELAPLLEEEQAQAANL